ncbi:MAG: FtsX-like permease family protein [bacterium]
MRQPLSTFMALRYLFAQRSALTYVSRLALLGLILSVAVLVIVLSIVNGFERELRDRVLGVLPHITAQVPAGLQTSQWQALVADQPLAGITALAPYISGTALLAANNRIQGINLTGIDSTTYGQVTDVVKYTRSQGFAALDATPYGIVLGARLARTLELETGDRVLVVLPVGAVTPAGALPRQRRFQVVDIFDSQSQLDGQLALITLSSAEKMFRTVGRVHGVQGRLQDLFLTQGAQNALQEALAGTSVRVRTWMDTHGNLYQAIAVQKMTMFVLLSFLVAVAAFNLVSGLMMIVEQRKNDVAVLRTLGADTRMIMMLFCTLGLLLALSGIVIGILTGSVVAWGLPDVYAVATQWFGLDLMSQYFIAYLPVDVRPADLLQVAVAAFVLTLLATLYPAWRATRLLPSRVLAHE